MKKLLATVAVVSAVAFSAVAIAAELKSGLQPGEAPPAFTVKDVTGPAAGTSLCYRCRYGGAPVVSIFAREVDENLASLIKQVDEQVGKNGEKKMKAFVVLMTDDPDAAAPKLTELAKKAKIKNVPLTIFDGQNGPPEYNISEDADLTVLMWVDSNVKVNHALDQDKLDKDAVKAIVGDTSKILN